MTYSSMLDEEVVRFINSSENEDALEYLMQKYKPLVLGAAGKCYVVGADKDDIIQEGMIGLCKAIYDYKGDKNSKFSTFAKLCVDRQIATFIKTSLRQKHKALNEAISIDEKISEEDYDSNTLNDFILKTDESPEKIVIDNENKAILEKKINQSLSDLEKQVYALHIKGISYSQIAIIMNRDEKSIDNTVQRIKKKVRKIVQSPS